MDYSFTEHRAACAYADATSSLVRSFKFNGRRSSGRLIAELMARSVPSEWAAGVIVPVPPRRASVRRRGYDAVGDLARHLGGLLSMPVTQQLRSSGDHEQKSLSYVQRLENVSKRFTVIDNKRFRASLVVLVDDVFTTGATLSECARLLRTVGVGKVCCLSFAMEL